MDLTPGTAAERAVLTLAFLASDLFAQFNVSVKNPKRSVVKVFCETVKNRSCPFKMVINHTSTIMEEANLRETATSDFKHEIERVRTAKDGITPDPSNLAVTNEKLLKNHDDLDQYPFYEVQQKLREGSI